MSTVREHLKAIAAGNDEAASTHAKCALLSLNAKKPIWLTPCMRAWHPLRYEQARHHCDEHGCGEPVLGRFLPDDGDAS